jgi:hypothetical protein
VRPRLGTLVAVTVWRLAIAGCALYGLDRVTRWSTVPPWESYWGWWPLAELSQLASAMIAVCYLGFAAYPFFTGGRRHEPRRSWLRGALTVQMWLVSLTPILLFDNHGRLDHPGFLFEHLVTPVVVTLDFLVVGQGQLRSRWWYPLTWIAFPLVYYIGLAASGFAHYGNLFPADRPGFLALVTAGFLVALIGVGYLLHGLAHLIGLSRAKTSAGATVHSGARDGGEELGVAAGATQVVDELLDGVGPDGLQRAP